MRPACAVAALLLAAAAAGCLGGADSGDRRDAAPTTGILQGLVVDPAIRPLAGAAVRLGLPDGTARNDTTDLDGRFSFGELAPGVYLATVALAGYLDASVQANVTAGLEPRTVRVVLEPDQVVAAFAEAYTFDGFLQCSFTAIALRQACDVDEATRPACATAPLPGCDGNLTQDRFLAVHAIGRPGVAALQSELQWEAGSDLARNLRAVPGAREPATGDIDDLEAVEGPAPLIVGVSGEAAAALGIGNGRDYAVRTFSSYAEGTAPPCLPSPAGCQWGVGVAYQQRFTMVTHAFYGFLPPEGWQFGRDGAPVPPPSA